MRSNFVPALFATAALFASTPALAVTTIDFGALPSGPTTGTADVTFSLEGGFDGAPPRVFGALDALTNTRSGFVIPTAYNLVSTFTKASKNISFTFDDYFFSGGNYIALDGMGNIVSSGVIDNLGLGFNVVNVPGTGIKTLKINNGNSFVNLIGIGEMSFTAVPEPATWAFMILGFGLVGGAMRRRATVVSTKVSYA